MNGRILTRTVWCTAQVEAFHYWPEGNPAFLADVHRHVFHVKLEVSVQHSDRDVEFIMLKQELTDWLREHYERKVSTESCEQMADAIECYFSGRGYAVTRVSVSEDGENGATLTISL